MVRFRIECDLPFSREDFWRLRASPSFLSFIVSDGLLKKMEASPTRLDEDGWSTRLQHYCPARVDCPEFVRRAIGDTMFEVDDLQRWHDELAPFEQHYRIRPSFLKGISRTSGTLTVEPHPDDTSGQIDAKHGSDDAFADTNDNSTADNEQREDPDAIDGDYDLGSASSATDGEGSDGGDSDCAKEPLDAEALLALLSPSDKSRHVVTGDTRVSILTLGWFIERAIVHNLRTFYKTYPATITRFRQKLYKDFADGDASVPSSVVVDRFLAREEVLERQAKEKRILEAEVEEDMENDIIDDDDNELMQVE